MLITHKIKKHIVSKNIDNSIYRYLSLCLTSKRGHYLALPANSGDDISKYHGWFNVFETGEDYTLYKSIEGISLDKPVTEVINRFTAIERRHNDSIEQFTITKNGLIYDVLSYHGFINIDVDFKRIFDNDDKGRIYKIYKETHRAAASKKSEDESSADYIIIEYTKYTGDDIQNVDHKAYLVIHGITGMYEVINQWCRKYYSYDAERSDSPEQYIYKALRILCKKNLRMIFAFSTSKDDALQKIHDIMENIGHIEHVYQDYQDNVLSLKYDIEKIAGPDAAFAYASSIHAIDGLSMNLRAGKRYIKGLWAGIPWFPHYWSRDELISLHALVLEHHNDYSKDVLMRYLAEIQGDGRLPNRYPATALGNADSIGWLFKRLHDYLLLCESRNNFDTYFSLYDLKYIRERLNFSIRMLLKNHSNDGLIINKELETWIDTYYAGPAYNADYREGARIEIQALFLGMLKLMNLLDYYLANRFVKKSDKLVSIIKNDVDYKKLEEDTRALVRGKFYNADRGVLNDGYACNMHDVFRPNVFLAYYLYPELLMPAEWGRAFDNILPRLWCEWDIDGKSGGGLATIDKAYPLYQPHYTGLDNKSYHRGDSWFWINNIAAISMYRLDKHRYKQYIDKILNASTQDILFYGFIGHASEITSSSIFRPAGCLAQAWSISTYIELIHEMYMG